MTDASHNSFKELYEARHEPENLRPIAEVYWRVVLVLSVITAGLLIFFGIWQFSSVISTMSSASNSATAEQKSAINREQLEDALVKFSERKANFELGKSMQPVVTDPSRN